MQEFGSNPEQKLPENCFNYITDWIDGISIEHLKNEYKVFSSSVLSLHAGIKLPVKFDNNEQITELNNSEIVQSSESEIDIDETEPNINDNITVTSILHVLNSFDLVSAFPNIYLAYRALGTVPASSASAERSFSKVVNKLILFFIIFKYFWNKEINLNIYI